MVVRQGFGIAMGVEYFPLLLRRSIVIIKNFSKVARILSDNGMRSFLLIHF